MAIHNEMAFASNSEGRACALPFHFFFAGF